LSKVESNWTRPVLQSGASISPRFLRCLRPGSTPPHTPPFAISSETVNEIVRKGSGLVNEIVIFSVGSRSAVSIPCQENFILAKNLPLNVPKPDSSLLSMEVLQPTGGSMVAFCDRREGVDP
jgi:hypothetical protein